MNWMNFLWISYLNINKVNKEHFKKSSIMSKKFDLVCKMQKKSICASINDADSIPKLLCPVRCIWLNIVYFWLCPLAKNFVKCTFLANFNKCNYIFRVSFIDVGTVNFLTLFENSIIKITKILLRFHSLFFSNLVGKYMEFLVGKTF